MAMTMFIIDQILLALTGIAMIICAPIFCGPIFTIVLQIIIALTWILLCRQLFLLPIDLVLGKKKETQFFYGTVNVERCEFFRKKYYRKCLFYNGQEKNFILTIPVVLSKEALDNQELPQQGQKIEVSFYPLSKILCGWNPC